jgi:hypothetical protein
MKLGFSSQPEDSYTTAGKRVLKQARAQLSQAVGEVLTGSLEALGERLQGNRVLEQVGLAAQAHALRLREVVERDRALIASHPVEREDATGLAPGAETSTTEASTTPPAIRSALVELAPFVTGATAVASAVRAPCREPIRTRTMAKLLASQGHRQRALSIYDHLLAQDPSEPGLEQEASALRVQRE